VVGRVSDGQTGFGHCPVLAPATLAALPSTRAIEIDSCAPAHIDLSVFPSMSLASPRLRSLASHLTRRYPSASPSMSLCPKLHSLDCDVFYVAQPVRVPARSPLSSRPYLLFRHSRFLDSSIEAMSCGKRCQEQARGLSATTPRLRPALAGLRRGKQAPRLMPAPILLLLI
jgi:hypothetical protein